MKKLKELLEFKFLSFYEYKSYLGKVTHSNTAKLT